MQCKARPVVWLWMVLCLICLPYRPVAAQVPDEKAIIGLNIPLSGSYIDQGKDQEKAYRLAAERINARGGVLGRKIELVIKDTKTDPVVAGANALSLIREHQAVMLTGGSSSAVALAQADVCQQNARVFMAALTHSNATTGFDKTGGGQTVQKAHRHTFRWYFNAWMTSKALVPYLVKAFGKGASYYYITSDYTWGHSLEESMRWGVELAGCDTAGAIAVPLGQSDFQKQLEAARNAKPDVLVLVLFGNDMVAALKQAHAMGLKDKMKIVVPLMELNMAHGVGPQALDGVVSTVNWYHGLSERFSGSKDFVGAFRGQYGKAPGSAAACAWVALHQWAEAAQRAASVDSAKVIRALEGHTFTLLKDAETWRQWDHQAVSSVFVVRGKAKGQVKDEWDLLEVLEEKKGEQVMQSREENPVTLERLPGE